MAEPEEGNAPRVVEDNKEDERQDYKKLFEESQESFNEDPARWLGLVRDKLFSMFRSPMKEEYAYEAFRWVAQLCMSAGDFTWMTTGSKWTQDEAKMFSLLARLSLAEIQILLPLIERHLTFGDEPELEDGKVLARSANNHDYDRFGTHLVIVESLIKSLVKDQTDDDDGSSVGQNELNPVTDAISPDELKNLLERFKETMTSICEYLELVHRHWRTVTANTTDGEKLSSAQGALRILSVWLSEDPGGFEPQCKRFLIDLMIESLMLDNESSRNDLTVLALHSVCAESDELVESCKRVANFEEALEKYLKYVQKEQQKSNDRRAEKMFKLRCGLVRDLAKKINKTCK